MRTFSFQNTLKTLLEITSKPTLNIVFKNKIELLRTITIILSFAKNKVLRPKLHLLNAKSINFNFIPSYSQKRTFATTELFLFCPMHFTRNRFLFEVTEAWSWNCLKHTEPTLTSKINYKNPPYSQSPCVKRKGGHDNFFQKPSSYYFSLRLYIYNRKNIHSSLPQK